MIGIQVNAADVRRLQRMGSGLTPALARGVLKAANYAGGVIGRVVVGVFPDGTGELARSFLPARFVETKETVSAAALSDLVYADILDRGGVIRPRRMRNLAIPLSTKAKRRWPRDWPRDQLSLARSRAGNWLLVERRRGGGFTPHYVLKKKVRIKGRHYIDRAAQEAAPRMQAIIDAEISAAMEAASRG